MEIQCVAYCSRCPPAEDIASKQTKKKTFRVVVVYFVHVPLGDRPHGKAHGKAAEVTIQEGGEEETSFSPKPTDADLV